MSGLIVPSTGFMPHIDRSAFIASNATLIGDVEIGANCSIWFTVLRGDGPGIRIGENSNPQDGRSRRRRGRKRAYREPPAKTVE